LLKEIIWAVGSSLLCSQYTSGWNRPWAPPKKIPGCAYESPARWKPFSNARCCFTQV